MKFTLTPTHSGLESKGKGLFGLEGDSYLIPVVGFLVTVILVFFVSSNPESGPVELGACALPLIGSFAFVFYFIHNRPKRFLADWLDGLAGRDWNISPRRRLKHPYNPHGYTS